MNYPDDHDFSITPQSLRLTCENDDCANPEVGIPPFSVTIPGFVEMGGWNASCLYEGWLPDDLQKPLCPLCGQHLTQDWVDDRGDDGD